MTLGEVETKTLFIANSNKELPVEVNFRKMSGVEVTPGRKILGRGEEGMFEVRVEPGVLGGLVRDVEVVLEGMYTVYFRVRAEVVAPATPHLPTTKF